MPRVTDSATEAAYLVAMHALRALLVLLPLLFATRASAVGQGNNLLPDIPLGPDTVRLTQIASISPDLVMDIENAGDGSGRLFIVSPRGVIRIWQNGAVLPGFFLNAPATPSGSAMSGLAFHPDYASNGRLYLITGRATAPSPHYTAPQSNTTSAFDNVLVEYRVSTSNPNQVDTTTLRDLLRIHKPEDAHNMNELVFAPVGAGYHLFVSTGDGGITRSGTPTQYQTNAQQTTLPYGKVLRIDVDAIGPNGRYAIPADNPFASGAGGNVPEIYAWGLRNPWRISTDRLTGALYTGNNGDFTIESVYRVELGRNYGWAAIEGGFLWDPLTGNASVDPAPNPAFTLPLARYDHNGTTEAFGSVIGGYVYRGARMPSLYGRYLFYDWVAGRLIAMNTTTGALQRVAIAAGSAALSAVDDIAWGEDEVGELYMGGLNGIVKKLAPSVLCGDLTGNADLALDDVARVRSYLVDGEVTPAELGRCSVVEGATSCDLLDSVVIRRAVAGQQPGVLPACTAAGG